MFSYESAVNNFDWQPHPCNTEGEIEDQMQRNGNAQVLENNAKSTQDCNVVFNEWLDWFGV